MGMLHFHATGESQGRALLVFISGGAKLARMAETYRKWLSVEGSHRESFPELTTRAVSGNDLLK